jgi:NAD(P)-dependent dehydrogenase (short-subunit alcohol dehydrogenase family)
VTSTTSPLVPDLYGLRGKRALVVGGGQGMGESSCRMLALMGADIAILDFDLERARNLAAELATQHPAAQFVALQADVLDDQSARSAISSAWEQLGQIDIMATIVGQAAYVPMLEMSTDQWDLDHRRNLRYLFVMAQALATRWVATSTPGNIVAVASVSGLQSAPKHVSYGAAKAGLMNLVKSMAVEWAGHGIRVNAVAPGSITTPRRPDSEERRAEMARSLIPMKRRGQCDDIGKAVLYLASDMSAYVTGTTLTVDGGWMAASMYQR